MVTGTNVHNRFTTKGVHMILQKIKVKQLFGMYDYNLDLIDLSTFPVTIIDAPNGMGKTTILRLIQSSIKGDIDFLDSIPFKRFTLTFDTSDTLDVIKKDTYFSLLSASFNSVRNIVSHNVSRNEARAERETYSNIDYYINRKKIPIRFQHDYRLTISRRIRMYTDRYSAIDDSVTLGSRVRAEEIFDLDYLKNSLHEVFGEYQILFIETNRLFINKTFSEMHEDYPYGRRISERVEQSSAVNKYKDDVKNEILGVGKRFADKSEELDRTFPKRVLNTILHPSGTEKIYTKDEVFEKLDYLEKERTKLSDLGLITDKGDAYFELPYKDDLSQETVVFLTNYIRDNITKLEAYKEISEKLRTLRDIVNNQNVFSKKTMSFNSEKGIVFTSSNGRDIPIESLSSGEKNNFILFYELIFESKENSLILVDEPEISLHVSWQRQFIDELNEICRLKHLQSIVATHSPDIVGNYFDYMVDLEDVSYDEE